MSLRFYGGPADDRDFGCPRAPRLIRAVCGVRGGGWDVLDQLTDKPRLAERIHLYEQTAAYQGMFICPGGYVADAAYRHVISPPFESDLDAVLRDTGSWRRFVAAYFGEHLDAAGWRSARVIPFLSRKARA